MTEGPLDLALQMARETHNRLIIHYTPHGVWFAQCGLYSQEGTTLNEVLLNLLQQRARFRVVQVLEAKSPNELEEAV